MNLGFKTENNFQILSFLLAALAFLIAITGVVGWIFDYPYLRDLLAVGVTMKFNTCLMLLMASIAMMLKVINRPVASIFPAFLALLIALLTFIQHLFGVDFRIDELFITDTNTNAAIEIPGRMSIFSALDGILLSLALLLAGRKLSSLSQAVSVVLFILVYASLLGYMFGESGLYFLENYSGISINTALSFFFLALSFILSDLKRGWFKTFTGDLIGAVAARYFLWYFLLISPVFIASYIYVTRLSTISHQFVIISLLALVSLFTIPFGLFTIRRLNRLDLSLRGSKNEYQLLSLKQSSTIEDLREKEEHLRIAIESANMGTWNFDLITGAITTSDRTRQLFGFEKDELLDFEKILQGVHPDHREAVAKSFQNALDPAGEGYYADEYMIIGIESSLQRWVRSTGKAFFDEHRKPIKLVGTVLDITEQKEGEDLKNKFIAMASHELKTPLTSLSGYIQLLTRRPALSEDQIAGKFVSRITKISKQVNQLVAHLLDVSAIQAGKLVLNYSCFNISVLINEILEELCSINPKCNIIVEAELSREVYADRFRMSQVITNFTTNAIKYSPEGETISIIIALLDNEKSLRLSVKDHGIGISQEDQEKLFKAFSRARNVYTDNIPGIGLGLHISSEIIRAHHGEIGVKSKLNEGSEFYFTIPIAPGE